MRLVFADTGAFYALADRKDPAHARAKAFLAGHAGEFITTDFTFAETMSLITNRLGKKTAVAVGEGIRSSRRIRIEEPAPAVRARAWELFSTRLDKDHDLIDCISFATMESFDIEVAFGFDRHFLQHGFTLVPS